MGEKVMLVIIVLLVPAILAIVALRFKKCPVEEIGDNGFSVPEAKKSDARWKYTQKVGPGFLLKTAGIALLVNVAIVALCLAMKGTTQTCTYVLSGWSTGIVVAALAILNWKVGKYFENDCCENNESQD